MKLRRTRLFLIAAVLGVLLIPAYAAFAATIIQDVNGFGIFELDGNVAHDSTTIPPYDWAGGTGLSAGGGIFNNDGTPALTAGTATTITIGGNVGTATYLASIFLDDSVGSDLAFITGGSKDIFNPQGNWQCTVKPVTPKDEIGHAYVAAFQLTSSANPAPAWNNHVVLYFALERGIVNGTSNAGFWLFSNPVTCDGSTGLFTGNHSNQDALLFATFNGGAATINAFNWIGGASGSLNSTPTLSSGTCVAGAYTTPNPPNPGLCAITNTSAISPPWDGGSAILPNGFFEGGIDLTDFYVTKLGLSSVPCLSSILADTRSSGSQGNAISSDLHDYIQGPFTLCQSHIATTPSATVQNGITLGGTATDTANISSSLAGAPAPTGTVTFQICGPLTSAAGCAATDSTLQTVGPDTTGPPEPAEPLVNGTATSDSFLPTATGYWCFRSTYNPDATATTNGYTTASEGAVDECFLVNKGPTTTVTTPKDGSGTNLNTSGPLTLGGSVTDTAVVSTTVSGAGIPAPTGNVNFFVCYSATVITGCSTGTQVGASDTGAPEPAEPLISGMATSDSYLPANSGFYCFRGVYSGDSNYIGSSDTTNEECFQVIGPPGLKTTMFVADEVTVTSLSNGGAVTPGSVVFKLYGPFASAPTDTACTASTPLYTSPATDLTASNVNDGTAHTTVAVAIPASNSTTWYAWGVSYSPTSADGATTNPRYTSASLGCSAEQVNPTYISPSGYVPLSNQLTVS